MLFRSDKGTTALRDNNNANSAEFTYSTCTLNGLASTRYLDGEYASSSASKRRVQGTTTYIFNVDRSSNGFSETMGYCYLDYAQRDVIQNLGFVDGTADKPSGTRAINKRQQVFSVDRLTQDNSYYSPSTKNITYGTGGVDDAEDAEVIWHEYGHSIQDNQVPGFGSSAEAGAMGEGFGDYWAGSLSARNTSAGGALNVREIVNVPCATERAGVSVRGRVEADETEVEIDDLPEFIRLWPKRWPKKARY